MLTGETGNTDPCLFLLDRDHYVSRWERKHWPMSKGSVQLDIYHYVKRWEWKYWPMVKGSVQLEVLKNKLNVVKRIWLLILTIIVAVSELFNGLNPKLTFPSGKTPTFWIKTTAAKKQLTNLVMKMGTFTVYRYIYNFDFFNLIKDWYCCRRFWHGLVDKHRWL